MSSTRNLPGSLLTGAAVVALATPLFLTGCQRIRPVQPDALNDEPLVVDEAMQIRDWDRSTAYYASGAVVAGDPRTRLEPKYESRLVETTDPATGATQVRQERTGDARINYVADPAIGLANFVMIPFTYFRTPPFTPVVSRGTIIPPSHYAMPKTRVID